MAKTKNTSTLMGLRLRIRIIHEIILKDSLPTPQGVKARDFLLQAVKRKLQLRGLLEVGVKTLEADIRAINQGDFPEADYSLTPLPNGKLYDLKYNHVDRCYAYHHERIPNIAFLDAEEEHSLAFLKGILAQHSDLPAVQRLMKESPAFFNQDIEAVDTQQVFLVNKTEHRNASRKAVMMGVMLRVLEHTMKEEVIQFDYVESQKLAHFTGAVPNKSTFRAYPLCLRIHDGFYFLSAVSQVNPNNKTPNKYIVRNFRIDQIDATSLSNLRDPKLPHTFERFNAAELWVKYEIQKKLTMAVGVWNMPESAVEEEVRIRFYGWAANHLMVFEVHPSQEFLAINEEENYVDLKFKFYTYPQFQTLSKSHSNFHSQGLASGEWSAERFPYATLFERYPEVGYLLGKYVNFMQVLT